MLFPTLSFGLFFLFIYGLTWSLKASNEWRKIVLLVASWYFYGAWDTRFVALLIASGVLNWGAARLIVAAEDRPKHWQPIPNWLGILITFHIVLLGWIFFRAQSFGDATAFIAGIFTAGGTAMLATPMLLAMIVVGMSFHYAPPYAMQRVAMRIRTLKAVWVGLGVGLTILIVDAMRPEGVAPFIYYQF